jgi:glycosyltransferase involved in cell wall biosynthesis
MATPLISIILPTFNMGKYLNRSIESILLQTFDDFELIVLNDGSTDETADLLASYAQKDPRIIVVHNLENLGLIPTLNKGLDIARGTFIARQDADNYSFPTRLADQVGYLKQHPHIGLVSARVFIVNHHGQTISDSIFPSVFLPPALIPWELLFYTYFAHDTIMARRDLLLQAGGYRLDRVHAEDYDLWCRLSRITQLAILPNVQACLFVNPEGVSQQYAEVQQQTVLHISRDAMSELLGQPISLTDATLMFKLARMQFVPTADDMHRTEVFFGQLHTAYLKKTPLTEQEKNLLEANVTNKLSLVKMLFLSTQFY